MSYFPQAYSRPGDSAKKCGHLEIDQTMRPKEGDADIGHVHLRHLLQAADPLPIFNDLPEENDPAKFFTEYLVRRGPRQTRYLRQGWYNELVMSFREHPLTEHRLLTILERVNLERTKEIETLSLFTALVDSIVKIQNDTALIRGDVECAFEMVIARDHGKIPVGPQVSFDNYCREPALLAQHFTARLAQMNPIGLRHAHEVAYASLTQAFSFDDFKKIRDDLQPLDVKMGEYIEREFGHLIEDFIRKALHRDGPPKKFTAEKWISEKVEALRSKPELTELMRQAYRDPNPYFKLKGAAESLQAADAFTLEGLPRDQILGADEFTPNHIGYFLVSKPAYIVSNYIYIRAFTGATEFDQLFELWRTPVLSLVDGILAHMKNMPPGLTGDELLRPKGAKK
jgi:hypothetical protein